MTGKLVHMFVVIATFVALVDEDANGLETVVYFYKELQIVHVASWKRFQNKLVPSSALVHQPRLKNESVSSENV